MTVGTCGSSIVSKSQIETMSMAQVEDQKNSSKHIFNQNQSQSLNKRTKENPFQRQD